MRRAVRGEYTGKRVGSLISRTPNAAVPAKLYPVPEDRMTEQASSLDARNQAELDQLSINTLRLLAVDQVEAAKSGHPGAPLGCSPIMYLLYHKFMKYNPKEPKWSDRDRFVLSNGHASAMLYGALHLTGYDLPLEQLKQFRQWGSHTPGHPEVTEAPGVEVTTGPLGQGLALAGGLGA